LKQAEQFRLSSDKIDYLFYQQRDTRGVLVMLKLLYLLGIEKDLLSLVGSKIPG
jgi:hypothetical protein